MTKNTKSESNDQENNPQNINRYLEDEIIKGVKSQKTPDLPISNKLVLKALQEGEDGDAYLFIKLAQNRYTYDHIENEWYYWNDHFWRRDKLKHIIVLIKELIDLYGKQLIYEVFAIQETTRANNEKEAATHKYLKYKLEQRIKALRTLAKKKTIIQLAASGLKSLGITGECWDLHPMLLTCKNGCIDLDKGEFKPGEPENYIKTHCPVSWENHKAECPIWKNFLLQMFNKDQDVIDYIQRLLGYGVTGLNTEHVFPIFWGQNGRNGKSTLFEVLKHILGDFMHKAPSTFLIQTKTQGDNSHDATKAALRGKRIVWCSETNESDRLDVAKLKEMVGGDTITARLPYAKTPTEFIPTYLMLILTNRCPKVPANDQALWKRIHLIPLINSFVDNPNPKDPFEFKADKKLLQKLKNESPGILAWLVEGSIIWQMEGLSPPESISLATRQYRKKEDIIGDYLRDCCVESDNEYLRVEPKTIYQNYKEWCDEVGHHTMSKKRFLEDLRNRFEIKKSHGTNYFIKIGLV